MMEESPELREAMDELEGAAERCASAQKEGPWCYSPEPEHLAAIQAARQKIVALFVGMKEKKG